MKEAFPMTIKFPPRDKKELAQPNLPPMNKTSDEAVDDDPSVFHCTLELRTEGDWCRGLVRVDEDGRVLFDEWVGTRALIASLLGNTQEPVMTCSCTVPECAGFYDQESRLSENLVHWSLRYEGRDLDLLFDRNAYEDAALAILKHFRSHPWEDAEFGTVPYEYKEFEDFAKLVDNMLASSPRLAEKWNAPLIATRPAGGGS